ncbi:hypothetical protein CTEN210_10595 [Chaetoceros tenuissimus]|uniref:NADP-dependent oxidoreductase domain-containing protein n=1 Tax=Chaetoceros tenuissimus TaxID=426638 RepID=A0AAD3D0Y8_9STRA|nr:hypothetical protein CTEN210_10595 [Chaetoceros tenuissimus]
MKLSIALLLPLCEAFSPSQTFRSTSLALNSSAERDEVDYVQLNRRDALSSALKTATAITGASTFPLVTNAEDIQIDSPSVVKRVPTVNLGNSSLKVSRTIQGYWQLAGGHGKYNQDEAVANMKAHFDAGITTLDTADIYGPSEFIVGKFVKEQKARAPEDKPVICTKFCCFKFLDDIDKNEVRTRVTKACERLQLEQIPLIQFFWSNYDIKKYVDVALMLTELREEGLIGEIGATNFDLKRLKEMKDAGVPIVSHQVQMSCLDQRAVQSGMADYCSENDISLIAFGTVGSGILSEKYLGRGPPTQEEKNTASMRMYSKTAERFGNWKLVQELLQTLDAVASDVRSSGRCVDAKIANIAQRYVLDTKSVASVLIGVRNRSHIDENINTHSFSLTDGERDAIFAVVNKRNGPKGDVWDIERGYA